MNTYLSSLLVIGGLLLSVNSSLLTAISSASLIPQSLKTHQNSQLNFSANDIQIVGDELIFSEDLHNQLTGEISQAQKELDRLTKSLSIKFNQDVGIVYLHRGQNNWSIKFTFGGIVLNTSEDIVVDTQEVFALKKSFEQIKWIEIKGRRYAATGYMTQVGGMLHAPE